MNNKMNQEMRKILDSYTVSTPFEEEKDKTLTILKEYLPVKKNSTRLSTALTLIEIALKELLSTCKLHYGIMIALLVVLFPILEASINPYLLLFFTAPIPLVIGIWNIYGENNHVMVELEKTFTYSYYQVLCSRLLVITGVSILFLSLPITYFFLTGFHFETMSLFKLIIWGLTPIFSFSVYFLFITTMKRNENILNISLVVWGGFGFAAISTPIGDLMLGLNTFIYFILIIISLLLLISKMARVLKTEGRSLQNG